MLDEGNVSMDDSGYVIVPVPDPSAPNLSVPNPSVSDPLVSDPSEDTTVGYKRCDNEVYDYNFDDEHIYEYITPVVTSCTDVGGLDGNVGGLGDDVGGLDGNVGGLKDDVGYLEDKDRHSSSTDITKNLQEQNAECRDVLCNNNDNSLTEDDVKIMNTTDDVKSKHSPDDVIFKHSSDDVKSNKIIDDEITKRYDLPYMIHVHYEEVRLPLQAI